MLRFIYTVLYVIIKCNQFRLNNHYKRNVKPRFADEQLAERPRRSRLLRQHFLTGNPVIIMDDKKYFTLANSFDVTNKRFYITDKKPSDRQDRNQQDENANKAVRLQIKDIDRFFDKKDVTYEIEQVVGREGHTTIEFLMPGF